MRERGDSRLLLAAATLLAAPLFGCADSQGPVRVCPGIEPVEIRPRSATLTEFGAQVDFTFISGELTDDCPPRIARMDTADLLADWTTTDPGVVTVDAAGVATARGVGRATIKATDRRNAQFSATANVEVDTAR